ncbi:MAG: hypothetical protein WDN28_16590 [Chthoniobacter sp.]
MISAAGTTFFHPPAVGVAHVHVFDEAHDEFRAAEIPRHGQDFVFVDPPLHDHVDLVDGGKARGARGLDPAQHAVHGEIHIVHRSKGRVVERIDADGEASQAGGAQGMRLLEEPRAIRREGEIAEAIDGGE